MFLDDFANLFADCHGLVQRGLREKQDELVPPVAGHGGIDAVYDSLEDESDLAQDLTSCQMTVAVVDDL
jgi:hypothetical protein